MKNFLVLFLLLSSLLQAQSFSSSVQNLSKELQTVENKKEEISQTVTEIQPGILQVRILTTQTKNGKVLEELYDLNMADIDVNTVKAFSNKDVIQVQLLVNKKQKLIKKITDNQKVSFHDEIFIFAKNIDNGRVLSEIFTSLIPLATDITEKRLSLNTYDEYINWLEKNIGTVALTDKQYVQRISKNPEYPGRLELQIDESTSKKTDSDIYHFNLANIDQNSLVLEIKGDVAAVTFNTRRKLNTVKYFDNGEQKNYTNNVVIYGESVEKARDVQKVLKGAIAVSENRIENMIPKITSVAQGLEVINAKIGTVIVNETTYNQSFQGDCVVQLGKKEGTPKKSTEETLFFNLQDLDKNLVRYDVKGKNVIVELKAKAGNKYMKHIVDESQKNYTSSIDVEISEVEDAIILEDVFKQTIGLCEGRDIKLNNSRTELLQQLKNRIHKVTVDKVTYDQSIESLPEGIFKFKNVEITDKKSIEKIWEFNYKDINPSVINFETKSKDVYVTVNTNYMEKIIKHYEDGAIGNYQNGFKIQAADIENARYIVEVLKKLFQQ